MKEWLRQIKWAYQRARYGYDETIKWEFDSYFSQFIQPLEEFCREELKAKELKFNPKRDKIFTKTLRLIKNYRKMKYNNFYKEGNAQSKLWEYVGKYIDYYWN